MSLKKLKVKFINWLFKGFLRVCDGKISVNRNIRFFAGRIDADTIIAFQDNTITEQGVEDYIEEMLQQNDLMYQRNK